MAGDIDKWEPRTRESADHSMPYTVAIALIHGEIEEKHFEDVYLRDPRILELTRRVKAKATEEADRRMPEGCCAGWNLSRPRVPATPRWWNTIKAIGKTS